MPEKSAQEVSRALRETYEKGKLAIERNNMDYAFQMLTAVLEREPGFYECRELLRGAQMKKGGGAVSGGGFFKKMLGSANPKVVQAQMALRKNPGEAMSLAEAALSSDPNNIAAHKVIAEAAIAWDFPKTAVLSLELVMRQSPNDRDVALQLAQALIRSGRPARAEAVLQDFAKAHPDDPDLIQAMKDISASRTLVEGGYGALADGQGSYRDILRDEKEAISLEQEKRDHHTEDITQKLMDEYEERLRSEPGNLRLVRSLAELCVQKKEFDRALEYYQSIARSDNPDPTLERAIAETRVKKWDWELAQLDPSIPDHAERVRQIQVEKQTYQLDDCRQRVERYPNDLQLRFELGQLYLAAGKIGEAIQEFQKAQNNPHKRVSAMYHLGLCFAKRGMNDLAARTFQNAIKEKPAFDDEKKELIYALALALEKLGKKAESVDQLKLIYEIDIGYKDVSARVDAFYAENGG